MTGNPSGSDVTHIDLLRDEGDLLHPSLANEIHELDDITIIKVAISLDEDHLLLTARDGFRDLFDEVVPVHLVLVQEHPRVSLDGENELNTVGIDDHIRFRLLGNLHIESLLQERSHDHENDEQDEHNVHERSNVDLRFDSAATAAAHSHLAKSPFSVLDG